MKFRVPLQLRQGSQSSYRVSTSELPSSCFEAYNSSFLSSCKRDVRTPVSSGGEFGLFLDVQQESQASFNVVRR